MAATGQSALQTTPPAALGASSVDRLRVFISYSRKDLEFSDQLGAALDAYGFTTTLDRTGIHGAENWERRLGQLILEADVVVFVLTPASVVSPVCAWEVDQALDLRKRIVPILASQLGAVQPHEALRDLNYIYFYPEPSVPGSGFGSGLARLIAALSIDVEWTREHTRLAGLASRWESGSRPEDMLLRGSELANSQRWRDTRPSNAPELTTLQRVFLQTSEDAETARINDERARIEERQRALDDAEAAQAERATALETLSRRTRYGLLGVSLLGVVSGIVAWIAYAQTRSLEGAETRLREGMTLKIADTDHAVHATEKWYRIATDYKLAIGVLRLANDDGAEAGFAGSGFLVDGGGLRSEWEGRVVFLTAHHVVRSWSGREAQPVSLMRIRFPGIGNDAEAEVESVLFDSEEVDVAVLGLGDLPRHAAPVDLASQIEAKSALEGIAVLHWTARDGFALGFGHGVPPPEPRLGNPEVALYYTHVTGPGASGAPVFDANSGNVVCLHIGVARESPRPSGYCTSIAKVVAAIGR